MMLLISDIPIFLSYLRGRDDAQGHIVEFFRRAGEIDMLGRPHPDYGGNVHSIFQSMGLKPSSSIGMFTEEEDWLLASTFCRKMAERIKRL